MKLKQFTRIESGFGKLILRSFLNFYTRLAFSKSIFNIYARTSSISLRSKQKLVCEGYILAATIASRQRDGHDVTPHRICFVLKSAAAERGIKSFQSSRSRVNLMQFLTARVESVKFYAFGELRNIKHFISSGDVGPGVADIILGVCFVI